MPLHLPTLLATLTALVGLALAAMLAFGLTQRVHRGFFAWVGAGACALAGTASALVWPATPAAWLPPLLAAPLGVVAGLRRFLPRTPVPGSLRGDAALLAGAATACAGVGAHWPALAEVALAAASALLHGHAAQLAWRCPARRDSGALRVLAGAFAAVAIAGAGAALAGRPVLLVLAAALAALLMVLLAMQFTHERTERELRESRRRLRFLANIDMLTRVPNRRRFGELARRALQREPGRAAMLMFDIDHFKRINDVLGHAAGDKALRRVARCVQDTLRTQDVAGRHGGDEFVLLLPGTGVREAMVVASRIAARVQDLGAETATPQISLSFGVVLTHEGETIDQALHRADLALYEAKRQGRSRVVAATGFDDGGALMHESRPLGLTAH